MTSATPLQRDALSDVPISSAETLIPAETKTDTIFAFSFFELYIIISLLLGVVLFLLGRRGRRASGSVVMILWWGAVASLPVWSSRIFDAIWHDLGCPDAGDCYAPGTGPFLVDVTLFQITSMLLLWPLCCSAIVRHLLSLKRMWSGNTEQENKT